MIDMVHTHTYGVLMAGGVGSRFWPMSRREQPKQFLDILDEGRTMIRSTAFRLEAVAPASHFYVVTGQLYQDEVLRQLPYLHPSQVLTEPVGRNTAPCIAYAAYRIYAEDPEAIMVVCPSDHHIDDAVAYQRVLHQAITYVAEHDVLMTIGIELPILRPAMATSSSPVSPIRRGSIVCHDLRKSPIWRRLSDCSPEAITSGMRGSSSGRRSTSSMRWRSTSPTWQSTSPR